MRRFRFRGLLWGFLALLVAGLLIPEQARIPVKGATASDWHPKSFWFEPWGVSGVHKGIDIFAAEGTPVISAVPGIRLYQGEFSLGGKVVIVLGPKWRLHYYAHLHDPATPVPLWVARGRPIGGVGDSGNAKGKPPHLHYSVLSLMPLPWRITTETQGWKKMFFLNPVDLIASPGS